MKSLFIPLACALLACGCGRQSPGLSVNLVSVHFKQATAFETTATFTLRLNNETPKAMQFTGGAHKIYLNGLYVGSGLSSDSIEVPRLSTLTNGVTVHLSNLALATRIKSVIDAKAIDYRILSVFYGKSWLDRTRCQGEGRLDLNDFMPATGPEQSPATNSFAPPAKQD